jgi:hypothetical protein
MSTSSDDEERFPECPLCWDDRGICDIYPHLDNDTSFTVKLTEEFSITTVCKDDMYFLLMKYDVCFFALINL